MNHVIVYRPRFVVYDGLLRSQGFWRAWVRDPAVNKLKYWPVTEAEAMAWYDANLPMRSGKADWSDSYRR